MRIGFAAWLALGATAAMGFASACSIDSGLTCGTTCGGDDATVDTTTPLPDGGGGDSASDTGAADTTAQPDVSNDTGTAPDTGPSSDAGLGGLDASCHSWDSSTPQWACPQSGCCPYGGNGYNCNSQGYCCRTNGNNCSSGNSCCSGACAQGSGGNGSCAATCAGQSASCTKSSDCCINTWCGGGNTCVACTAHHAQCTSSYECCGGDQCQNNLDGGKTCESN